MVAHTDLGFSLFLGVRVAFYVCLRHVFLAQLVSLTFSSRAYHAPTMNNDLAVRILQDLGCIRVGENLVFASGEIAAGRGLDEQSFGGRNTDDVAKPE